MRKIISITPRFLIVFAFTMLLAACGGGSGGGDDTTSPSSPSVVFWTQNSDCLCYYNDPDESGNLGVYIDGYESVNEGVISFTASAPTNCSDFDNNGSAPFSNAGLEPWLTAG
ncbi:MAG: hypothetical protein V3S46_02655, partial [Nitrospinota bacterium]